jgi:predicted RNA-binding Zn-ribbon protein involved in translation (DUF1610 family)
VPNLQKFTSVEAITLSISKSCITLSMPDSGAPFIIHDLNATCPNCGYEITPLEMEVITTLTLTCPKCGHEWPSSSGHQLAI